MACARSGRYLLLSLLFACVGTKGGEDTDPSSPADSDAPADSAEDPGDSGGDSGGDTGGGPDPTLAGATLRLVGVSVNDQTGGALARAGDVDGDGRTDLLISAYGSGRAAQAAGLVYLVLGGTLAGWSGTESLSEADLALTGEHAMDNAGLRVVGPGDVDGDGYDDMLIGAAMADENAGAAYLVAGPGGTERERSLADADLELYQDADIASVGAVMASVGDVDGDGAADLIFGLPYDDSNGHKAGAAALVLGITAAGSSEDLDLDLADLRLLGDGEGDALGKSVAGGGDVDGDGLSDVWVGAWYATRTYAEGGAAYLLLGASVGTALGVMDAADADLTVEAELDLQGLGAGVAMPGDVDGDGLDDLLIGARYRSTSASLAGGVLLFLSSSLGTTRGTVTADTADAELMGNYEEALVGDYVAGAGDVDADGLADVLIGSPGDTTAGDAAGVVWLVMGASLTGGVNPLPLSAADAPLYGEEGDHVGSGFAGLGDLDGDGRDDLMVGAPSNATAASYAGLVYLLSGSQF